MQVIEGLECSLMALLRLLNCFCFGRALSLVGQVTFSGRCCMRCGVELFSLYKFAEDPAEALSTVSKSSEYQKL